MTNDKQANKENSEIINKLYSNNTVSEKHDSKSELSEIIKLKDDEESEKYIKEMRALADKNEFKNNIVVLGLGIVIVSAIVFSILMNISFNKPKTDVTDNKIVTKSPIDKSSAENKPVKTIDSPTKIFEYLDVEANRTSVLKKSVALNSGNQKGLTVYLLSEILRSNTYEIPTKTSTIKQLAKDLTSMNWKKNTDFTQLKKGDICFTTDMPEKPGSPSHAYVFMGWVKDGKTDYAYICDGQVEEFGNIYHKRNLAISTTKKDKFSYFLRK